MLTVSGSSEMPFHMPRTYCAVKSPLALCCFKTARTNITFSICVSLGSTSPLPARSGSLACLALDLPRRL